jgi:CheY-like chemotaxis protein
MNEPFRVVLIDDDAGQLDVLSLMIRQQRPAWRLSASCVAIADRDRALDAIRATVEQASATGQVDLLLIDDHLGEHRADDLLGRLSLDPIAVIMTGNSVDEDAPQPFKAEAMVSKPFSLADAAHLFETCDRLLAKRTQT